MPSVEIEAPAHHKKNITKIKILQTRKNNVLKICSNLQIGNILIYLYKNLNTKIQVQANP